ncbi:MarR family winged helix-turn-helix transcriptional regulator [Gallaecimonas mangrovi]|uniref:MarR family winged helix-turn-helix transcriptional regulator n=1 Tax=Gallaecimonas mangrovi TaxID=2291597 RepID=UPI000E2098AC|nr:MarR family transcriptional regulator [Gallaecimonas mangrovi]
MKPEHLNLGAQIAQIGRQWRLTLDKKLHPFGLTQATWLPLWCIKRNETALRQKDLAAQLGVDGSALVRILDTLEKQEFIYRQEGEDRRAKTLHLTDKGRQITSTVDDVVNDVRLQVLGPINESDLDITQAVLKGILQSLCNLEKEKKQ